MKKKKRNPRSNLENKTVCGKSLNNNIYMYNIYSFIRKHQYHQTSINCKQSFVVKTVQEPVGGKKKSSNHQINTVCFDINTSGPQSDERGRGGGG